MMLRRCHRYLRAGLGAAVMLGLWWLVAPPVAMSVPRDVSGTLDFETHSLTYTVTGVDPDGNDQPANHSGTVTGSTITLSGTATYSIAEGYVTNLGMGASLSAGGNSAQENWPPEGVDGRVGGTTITFPFSLTVEVPPPPEPEDTVPAFGETPDADATPEPYTTAYFTVYSRNCNDSGVCGAVEARGVFQVYGTTTRTPTVDWVATVGALGAAAAAAVALAGARTGRGEDTGRDRDQWRYVLQVSTDRLAIDPGATKALQVQVWAVNGTGTVLPATDTLVRATASGPFTIAPASGQQALHAAVTATGPHGSTGTMQITTSAGPTGTSATVALVCEGATHLDLVPVGESVIRPDSQGDGYSPVLVDVRLVAGTPPAPIDLAITAAGVTPDGLLAITDDPPPGAGPGARLRLVLAADPAVLAEPANRQALLTVSAVPAGQSGAPTATGSLAITLAAPELEIRWW